MTDVHANTSARSSDAHPRLGALDMLVLAAALGLAAGELEVASRVIYRALSSTQRLYLMTRHFVWLVPLVNLALFLAFGLVLVIAIRLWPRRAAWLGPRLMITFALLPPLSLVGRNIYLEAWFLVALGIALRLTPLLERHSHWLRRPAFLSIATMLGAVLLQAGFTFGPDQLAQWREDHRALPTVGSPNVLLIVLDTVRADHLSLYGYHRPTSPNLERLAKLGVRFDRARAAAPWTLASHASMFTGLWPHQIDAQWTCPLRDDVPTIAEYLQSLGYATAGFAGNTFYCSYDSGLNRGFTHYEDYVVDRLSAVRTVHSISESLKSICPFLPIPIMTLRELTQGKRKNAQVVNQQFLEWLNHCDQPQRPFFAFLNYIDAHVPYILPRGATQHFGRTPRTPAEERLLATDWTVADKARIPPPVLALARDAYDNCLSYLDEQIGAVVDDLDHRGMLENTLVIITADHGESLGEHQLFEHGESLYRPEIAVPLLIIPPRNQKNGGPLSTGRSYSAQEITEFVSLRNIAATIATVVRPDVKPPFPGRSLLSKGAGDASGPATDDSGLVLSELASPNPSNPNRGRSPAARGPLISLAQGDFVYIRKQTDKGEELFNVLDDPGELNNLAKDDRMLPTLRRYRAMFPNERKPIIASNDATHPPPAPPESKP